MNRKPFYCLNCHFWMESSLSTLLKYSNICWVKTIYRVSTKVSTLLRTARNCTKSWAAMEEAEVDNFSSSVKTTSIFWKQFQSKSLLACFKSCSNSIITSLNTLKLLSPNSMECSKFSTLNYIEFITFSSWKIFLAALNVKLSRSTIWKDRLMIEKSWKIRKSLSQLPCHQQRSIRILILFVLSTSCSSVASTPTISRISSNWIQLSCKLWTSSITRFLSWRFSGLKNLFNLDFGDHFREFPPTTNKIFFITFR